MQGGQVRALLVGTIVTSGWVLAGTYLTYEFFEYGPDLSSHLLDYESFTGVLFHFLIFTAPLMSAVLGFLVNERIKLTGELKALEEKYRDYYEHAPYGYHSTDVDGVIIEVNSTWLRMLGYQREEVVGRMRISDIVEEGQREDFGKAYEEFKKSGSVVDFAVELKRKDGTQVPVTLSSSTLYGERGEFIRSRTIVKDVSERKKYEEAILDATEEWKATFDSMPWGVMLIDRNFNIIRANDYISRHLNTPAKELVARKCFREIHGTESPVEGCALIKSAGDEHAGMLEYQDEKTGRHFRLYCMPLKRDGVVKSYVHSLVDITDIRQGEAKLMESRDAFFNMLKDVTDAYGKLKELHDGLILSFANAIDAKSPWTKGHSERVSRYSSAIAVEMGLSQNDTDTLRTAALLHDIGKIGTYDYLLDKPEGLTEEEYEVVKKHPLNSARILEPISRFKPVIDIVKYHHERWDGKGYPEGIRGYRIPLMARILCVADSFDSMTADRPYRPAPGIEYAMEELKKCSGRHFDPDIVMAFLRALEKDKISETEKKKKEHGNTTVHR